MISRRQAFVLASASPRRKELLAYLNLPQTYQFAIDTDETIDNSWTPEDAVIRLSLNKGLAVLSQLHNMPQQFEADTEAVSIISADTIVVIDNQILGKPKHKEEAYHMLKLLQGRAHKVYTGLTLMTLYDKVDRLASLDKVNLVNTIKLDFAESVHDASAFTVFGKIGRAIAFNDEGYHVNCGYTENVVTFRPLTDAQIWAYIETGDPLDKAGSYGIQGVGAVNIESINGDFYSVMGLPLSLLNQFIVEHQ